MESNVHRRRFETLRDPGRKQPLSLNTLLNLTRFSKG